MLRRPKRSKNEVVASKEEEETSFNCDGISYGGDYVQKMTALIVSCLVNVHPIYQSNL
jgi:hypothetical protein